MTHRPTNQKFVIIDMLGLINLCKPPGFTSRDCVNIISRNLGTRKVGHAGTLDPIAQGVLVVAVGQATRIIEFVQGQAKTYRGVFELGLSSPSLDRETPTMPMPPNQKPTFEMVQKACESQIGTLLQTPPAFSAIKLNGVRAYSLARQGIDVEIQPRKVEVDRCEIVDYSYPRLELRIVCGSGTYVRSIGRDIAIQLGTAAIMTELIREKIGVFDLNEAVALSSFRSEIPQTDFLLPMMMGVANLPKIELVDSQILELMHGKAIELRGMPDERYVSVCDQLGSLKSIVKQVGAMWKAEKNFCD